MSAIDDSIQAVSAVKERYQEAAANLAAAVSEVEGATNQATALGAEGMAAQFGEVREMLSGMSASTSGLVEGVESVVSYLEGMKT